VKPGEPSKCLNRFRRRAEADPFFVGHALSRFAKDRGLGDPELAKFLGCSRGRLPHLMACRSPDPQRERFAADVRRIAEYVRCSEDSLLLALREVSVLEMLRALPGVAEGGAVNSNLLAARQHRKKQPNKGTRGSDRGRRDDRP
jgi:hypothetical protein